MFYEYRYIQIDDSGKVIASTEREVSGVSIDIEGMTVPEMPTDAFYDLYYNETEGLHYVKVADFEPAETPNQDELQWQAITDLEISQMEYNQALTDLEIKYLEGGINK